MSTKGSFVEAVEAVVGPLLERQGFELVLVEFVERSRILRLYVDSPKGVSLDDCTKVSHLVGDVLDGEGLVAVERYTLEVSSPGLDRPLAKPAHYQRFVGREITVVTRQPQEGGRRKFRGVLEAADDSGIGMQVEGKAYRFTYDAIERARLVPEY